jgi:cytochrome c-type biogenesis protein CcmH/NrfG
MIEPRDQVFETIKVALEQHDRRAAFALLRKALEQDPTDQEAWQLLYATEISQINLTVAYWQVCDPKAQRNNWRRDEPKPCNS